MAGLTDFVDAWNAGDAAGVAAQFTPDGVRHQLALPEARLAGRAAIEQGVGMIIHAVPDLTLGVVATVAGEGNRVTFEWLFEGTLTNDFPGLPASGQHFALPGISLCTLTDDGAIVEERVYWDGATLMAAAGLLG